MIVLVGHTLHLFCFELTQTVLLLQVLFSIQFLVALAQLLINRPCFLE